MLIAFSKPYDVLSQFTQEHPSHRTLAEFGFPPRVYPIGRLDRDSEGLILLSDEAQMNSKPELEIYADDVKCSHGSTTGQLDDEAMFYLQSRGLSPDNARRLLTTAFINDVLNHVENEAVRAHVIQRLEQEGLLYH